MDSENNKPDSPVYQDWEQKHQQQLLEENDLKNQFLLDLNSNERYTEFFNQFRSDTVESFKTEYARMKARLLLKAAWFANEKEKIELHFYHLAEESFWMIQQKKLFDRQCLWRAEKVTFKEVEICDDFDYWSENIKACPFVPPVSEDELELLRSYFLSPQYQKILFKFFSWYDYETFKNEHTGDSEVLSMPEWYHYYNMHRGTESLMLLPDVRWPKEEFYMQLGFEHGKQGYAELFPESTAKMLAPVTEEDEEDEEQKKPKPRPHTAPDDNRPWLSPADKETLDEFVNEFEDKEIKNTYRIFRMLHQKDMRFSDSAPLTIGISTLRLAGDNYPMEPWPGWVDGIVRLANKFEGEKMAGELDQVYEQYLFRIENNIPFPLTKEERDRIRNKEHHVETYKNWILHGRKKNNEPADFNF